MEIVDPNNAEAKSSGPLSSEFGYSVTAHE